MRSTSPSPLLDFSSKGLYNVQPNEPSIESPWRQGGRCVEVLSGVGELRVREEWPINGKRRSVRDAEGGLVGDGNHLERSGSAGGQGSEDGLPVYYEVLISPDRDAIKTFHLDHQRFLDLSTHWFPYLQDHLAFWDDTPHTGLWTITKMKPRPRGPMSRKQEGVVEGEEGVELVGGKANREGEEGNDSEEEAELGEPVSLRRYWREFVKPLKGEERDGGGADKQRGEEERGEGDGPATRLDMEKRYYLAAIDILVTLAELIIDLNERKLCMAICRPSLFAVRTPTRTNRPTHTRYSEAISNLDDLPTSSFPPTHPEIVLHTLSYLKQISLYAEGAKVGVGRRRFGPRLGGGSNGDGDGDGVGDGMDGMDRFSEADSEYVVEGLGVSEQEVYVETGGVVRRPSTTSLNDIFDDVSAEQHMVYIAPEALSGTDFAWQPADVYTWGACAYHLFCDELDLLHTGEHQERGDLLGDIHRHATTRWPPLTQRLNGFPSYLSQIIAKAVDLLPEARYASLHAILLDLEACRPNIIEPEMPMEYLQPVGHYDKLSRFSMPEGLVDRDEHDALLNGMFDTVRMDGVGRTACLFGESGTGKTKAVEYWIKQQASAHKILVGNAKLDQHQVKPLGAIVQVFESLLTTIFSDPTEDRQSWKMRILQALPSQGLLFLTLLSPSWQNLLLGRIDTDIEVVDWETYAARFRLWATALFKLFATPQRPLVIFIDDWQWLDPNEKLIWAEILENPSSKLKNCITLITFRIERDNPLNLQPLHNVETKRCEPLASPSIKGLLKQAFGLVSISGDLPKAFDVLASFLTSATNGNPLYLQLLLSKLVRDGVIAFDFDRLHWRIATSSLADYNPEGIEAFASWTMSSLSSEVQQLLKILSLFPAKGLTRDVLARLLESSPAQIRSWCESAETFGITTMRFGHCLFVHDKYQASARAIITEDERSDLLVQVARTLDKEGQDFLFVRADIVRDLLEIGINDWTREQLCCLLMTASQKAIRSAAFDTALGYIQLLDDHLQLLAPESWKINRDTCWAAVQTFVAAATGLRKPQRGLPAVEMALASADTVAEKIQALTLQARLHVQDFDASAIFRTVDTAFGLVGLTAKATMRMGNDVTAQDLSFSLEAPETPEELRDWLTIAEAKNSCDEQFDDTATALVIFMLVVGPQVYTRLPQRGRQHFDYAAFIALKSHRATMHPASGYLFGVQAVQFAGMTRYQTAQAYYALGMQIPWRATPYEGPAEIAMYAVEYLRITTLAALDFHGSWDAASAANQTEILLYISTIELSSQVLYGRSIPLILSRSQTSLHRLRHDLARPVRPFLSCFLQFALNLSDTHRSLKDLQKLEGAVLDRSELDEIYVHGDVVAVTFAVMELYNAILFNADPKVLDEMARNALCYREGWSGVVADFNVKWILSCYCLITDRADTDSTVLDDAHQAFASFPQNGDFQALRSALFGMQGLRDVRKRERNWPDVIDVVESSIRLLEASNCNLATGFVCLTAARVFRYVAKCSRRIWEGYVRDSQLAFARAGATALIRVITTEFADVFGLGDVMPIKQPVVNGRATHRDSSEILPHSDSSSGSDIKTPWTQDEPSALSQRLNFESILKSFLAFASEKDRRKLIKQVLTVLIQTTRSEYGCLINGSTEALTLLGWGTLEDLRVDEMPLRESPIGSCPTILLTQIAHSQKALDSSNVASTPVSSDPFLEKDSSASNFIALPIFIQKSFAGVVFLSGGMLKPSATIRSPIELVATFALIILSLHGLTASLEAKIRLRTSQLEEALAHRSTFIHSITHELRTPLHSISGLTVIMENSPEFPETHKDNLLGIRNSADDLQRIISDVLDLSKLESGSMSLEAVSCNIRTIAEGALESAASSAHSKGLELVLLNSLDTDPPHQIISDPFRLRQCIIGLVGNSLKFTALGRISLTYSIEPAPSGGLILKFAVEDTGIGIAKESFDKLFKPFSQVDASINRRHGGSGLGLSIIANLARLLGGAAWCEKSAVGQGSTFCFSATVYADPDSTIIPPRRAVPASALVVAQSTETTAAMLRNLDVMAVRAITCAPGSLEAYEDMDFVLLDNNLGPSGLTAVQEYTAKRPKVKVVYLTELVDRASFQHKVADTSAKIITKPIKSSALFEAVDDAPKGQGEKGKKRRPNTATTIDKDTAERYPLSILFVDDNPINRSVGTKILAKFGYKILDTAQDGAEAVAATEKKDYDIVFLDLQMPVMDGHTALKKILESKSEEDVPYIVALTANADLNTRKKCLADGFHSFLSKPLIIRELDAVFKAAYQAKHGAGSVGTPMAGSPSL